jgi:hypothetical protein
MLIGPHCNKKHEKYSSYAPQATAAEEFCGRKLWAYGRGRHE